MNKELRNVLTCGAKNNALWKELRARNFYYVTYGWDKVVDGVYYRYDNELREFVNEGNVFPEKLTDDELYGNDMPRNYYAWRVPLRDIAILKERVR